MEGHMRTVKIGLEIHQQLETHKLFCKCASLLSDGFNKVFIRRMHFAKSELGEIDKACVLEYEKGLKYEYQITENSCLVEYDDEPPQNPNIEAIKICMIVAKMLNAKIVDEIHFMRKIVIDGSNTSGFQRTAIIAIDGYLDIGDRRIDIPTICVEEDACRKIHENDEKIIYRVDRQGIPLIEISTSPEISSPEEAEKVAEEIGKILRATKRVRRGIGSIRNDINISVEGGARTEIKGVQELRMISHFVKNEIKRQEILIDISENLKIRGVTYENCIGKIDDITDVFKETECKMILKVLEKGGIVKGIVLKKFSGLLKNELGKELAYYAKSYGAEGVFHSDNLPAYGIKNDEVERVKAKLQADNNDAFVLIADMPNRINRSVNAIVERAKLAVKGVPEETRDPLHDGTTMYSRPLPGAERMYPETDVIPIQITNEMMEEILMNVPELPNEKIERFCREFKISRNLAEQIINSEFEDDFEYFSKKYDFPRIILKTLINTISEIRNAGIDVSGINREFLDDLFSAVYEEKFAKEAIPQVIITMLNNKISAEESARKLGLSYISHEEVKKILDDIFEKKSEIIKKKKNPLGYIMGEAMRVLRGKIDGKDVKKYIQKKIEMMRYEEKIRKDYG